MKLLTLLSVLLFFLSCSKSNQHSMKDQDQQALVKEYDAIQKIYASFTCEENIEWTIIGLGEKACGGHKEFIAYPNQINQEEFNKRILDYNKSEKDFNIKYNIISTCEAIIKPNRVVCQQGKPILVYNNIN